MTENPTPDGGRPRTFHRYRAEVLEQAVSMEHLMGGVISAAYGQSASTALELQTEILGRLPIQQRVSTLKRILEKRELTGAYAFVVPILNKVFAVRNDFAHSIATGYDARNRTVNLVSMRKGEEVPITYDALYLHWLLYEQCPPVERELQELYYAVAPQSEDWHES